MHRIPRARRPVVALTLISSGCVAASLVCKPATPAPFLLGWLAGLVALVLVARLQTTTARGGGAWVAGALRVVLAAVAVGYLAAHRFG